MKGENTKTKKIIFFRTLIAGSCALVMKVAPLFIGEVSRCESWWNSWIESKNNCRRQLATFFPIFIWKHSIFVATEKKKKNHVFPFEIKVAKWNTTFTILTLFGHYWTLFLIFEFFFYLFIFSWSAFKAFFFIYFTYIFFTKRQMYKYIIVQKILEIFYLDYPLYMMNRRVYI